jgi:hypothetical protein
MRDYGGGGASHRGGYIVAVLRIRELYAHAACRCILDACSCQNGESQQCEHNGSPPECQLKHVSTHSKMVAPAHKREDLTFGGSIECFIGRGRPGALNLGARAALRRDRHS